MRGNKPKLCYTQRGEIDKADGVKWGGIAAKIGS